jgi:hypothetical protein
MTSQDNHGTRERQPRGTGERPVPGNEVIAMTVSRADALARLGVFVWKIGLADGGLRHDFDLGYRRAG